MKKMNGMKHSYSKAGKKAAAKDKAKAKKSGKKR
jgi:hypothetical protein